MKRPEAALKPPFRTAFCTALNHSTAPYGHTRLHTRLHSTPLDSLHLPEQTRQFSGNIETLAPGAFISMVIPLAVFFAFQRQFVSGVMAGAVK